MKLWRFSVFLLLLPLLSFADVTYHPKAQAFIQRMVAQKKFSRCTLEKHLHRIRFLPTLAERMNAPTEKKSWARYRSLFVNPDSIQKGRAYFAAHRETLHRAEKKYGVPAEIIAAVLGVETRYGKIQGSFPVGDVLATLAFQYPAREKFFTDELEHWFFLCQEQRFDPVTTTGSYAGPWEQPSLCQAVTDGLPWTFLGTAKLISCTTTTTRSAALRII